jgi:hypothetical protein
MPTPRTVSDKIADTRRAYEAFRDELTTPDLRAMLLLTTGPEAQAQMVKVAESGDYESYRQLVQTSLSAQRIVSGNDRAAMLAAAMVTQSGVVKPVIDPSDPE